MAEPCEPGTVITGTVLPCDTAFSLRTLAGGDQPAVSPDGKWVAYAVYTPPLQRPTTTEPHYLPNGTPLEVLGNQLFLTEAATRQTRLIGPTNGNSWRPSWSPDSKRVAFFSDAAGVPQLWVYALLDGEARTLGDAPIKPGIAAGDEAIWSPNGKEIYVRLPAARVSEPQPDEQKPAAHPSDTPTVTVEYAGEEESRPSGDPPGANHPPEVFPPAYHVGLAAIDTRSGLVRTLVPAETIPRPGCMQLSPSGQWVSYLSVLRKKDPTSGEWSYDLALVPATGGPVYVLGPELCAPDNPWLGAYQWHPSRDLLVYLKDRRLWLVDLAAGGEPTPCLFAAEVGDLSPSPIAFSRDGQYLVVRPIENRESTDGQLPTLAVLPLDGGPPRTITVRGKGSFLDIWQANRRTLWQPQPGFLTAAFHDEDTGETAIARVSLESGETEILRREHGRFGWTAGGGSHRSLLAIFEDASTPPDLYEFSHDLSRRKRLTHIEPRLDEVQVGPVVTYETSIPRYDGKMVRRRSALFLPHGAKQGDRLPAVAFIYGGHRLSLFARWYGGGSPATIPALLFTTRGYAVLTPDLPLGPEGTGTNPLQDLTDVLLPQIYHAGALEYIDLERVALIGHSYGGYEVAGVLSQTNVFRAGVALAGLYDLTVGYADKGPYELNWWFGWLESGVGRMGAHPWADQARYIANSPFYQAEKIRTPLLLVSGEKDFTALDARKMFNALKRLGRTAQLAIYAGEGHVISEWSRNNAVDVSQRIFEFLERSLGSSWAEPAPISEGV